MDLGTTPGIPPPDGQESHFHEPYNSLQIGTVIAFGITYLIATGFLALRYFQAFKLTKKIEIDLSKILTSSTLRKALILLDSHYHDFLWYCTGLFRDCGELQVSRNYLSG